jgi:replication factor A1
MLIELSVDELIKKIVEKSGIEESEIRERVEAKRTELNGLITLEGAAHIIAGELGITFLEDMLETRGLKLENVIPGMSSVDIVGKITRLFEYRTFQRDDGSEGKLVAGIVSDNTSSLRIVFWDEKAELVEKEELKEGDIIRLKDGYTKENRNGEAEIHTGNRARIVVNPEDIDSKEFPTTEVSQKKLSELSDGMQGIDVVVKVLRVYEPREFAREDSSTGKVVNIHVADDTKKARLVLWDEDVGLVEKGEVKVGDIVKVRKGYVRERFEELELHVGKYGKLVLNPPDVELDEVVIEDEQGIKRTSIENVKPGMKVEIRGAFVRIYDNPTIYEKDGEKRFVVNGVIDDGTGRLHAVFFNKMGEILLNTTVNALAEGEPMAIVNERGEELLGKEVLVMGNLRQNEQSGRLELIVFDMDLNPDPKTEIEALLKQADTLIGGQDGA